MVVVFEESATAATEQAAAHRDADCVLHKEVDKRLEDEIAVDMGSEVGEVGLFVGASLPPPVCVP